MIEGDDPRWQLARLIRGVRNDLRREGRPISTRLVMQRLYDHCLAQKLKFRESRAIACWYDRIALYALDRDLKARLAGGPFSKKRKALDRRNNSVTRYATTVR